MVNPAAGGGRTRRLWPTIRDRLTSLGFRFDHVETTGPGDAVRLAEEAVARGVGLVVAVGGDGTLSEVVNGIADPDAPPRVAVGAILTGRGRDTCRALGVPRDPIAAAERLVAGREVLADLGLLRHAEGRRFFVNAAGAGFDATVAATAARSGGRGTLAYLRAVLGSLQGHRPLEATVEHDAGEGLAGPVTAVVLANGAHFGGGMKIAPGADPADGLLDLVVIGGMGRMELLRWLPTIYWGGHLRHPGVRLLRVRRARVGGPDAMLVEADGEVVGQAPLDACICPGALRLRV